MRTVVVALLGSTFFFTHMAAAQQNGAADLCRELLAYAEKKAAEPPKGDTGQAGKAEEMRGDRRSPGTQGGGSSNRSTSSDTSGQSSAAPTAPVSTGAASEPATSGHANSPGGDATGSELAGGVTLQQLRETGGRGDRRACRDTAQTLRRAGADLPAALIALAAFEPGRQN